MNDEKLQDLLKKLSGNDLQNMPKYIVLGDGTAYFYVKEEDKYALCEQTPSVQEGIPTAEGSK